MRQRLAAPANASWQALRLAETVRTLGLGCTMVPRSEPAHWYGLIGDPGRLSVLELELHLGRELLRARYNEQSLAAVRSSRKTQLGECSGFHDFWVPVLANGRLEGVLAFGPFLTEPPTLDSLQRAWDRIGGSSSDANDRSFVRYVECAVDAHVYAGPSLEALRRYLERVAGVLAGSGPRLYARHLAHWRRLLAQVPEARMWQIAADLVDRERHVTWTAALRSNDLAEEGILHMPDQVMLVMPSAEAAAGEAAAILRGDRLQRACAAFAAETGSTIAGRHGRNAAVLLLHLGSSKPERWRGRLEAIAERLSRFLRRALGVEVTCGVGRRARSGDELYLRHDEALRAALWGLHTRRRLTFYGDAASAQDPGALAAPYLRLRNLREALVRAPARDVAVATEHLIKDVLWIAGGNLDALRSHFLELAWDLVAVVDRRSGVDERTSVDTLTSVSARLQSAPGAAQLTSTFKTIVSELRSAMEKPSSLGRRAKLERARRLVLEATPGDSLDLGSVAKRVGLSSGHFSRCFREAFSKPFGAFVLSARLQRSHALLRETKLSITDVARECGFSSGSYFVQAFKRSTGLTPSAYRLAAAGKA